MVPLLAAREIAVRYDPQSPPILADLTFALRPGEFVGVVGPNGSGKSTLVRALSRTLKPTSGLVLLAEQDLYAAVSARASAQRISVVPQTAAVTFGFTVREVVRMGRSPHLPRRLFAGETAADERIVDEALRDAGVEALAERVVTTLSGGEWQRTLLARALAQQTDVVLLDEPTAHLDIRHEWETLALLAALVRREQKAVLAVLHDLNLAAAYCDRLLLLSGGRIVAEGTPAEVLTPVDIQRVYGARVWVRCHPTTGRPVVLSLPELVDGPASPHADAALLHVHVVCGGGTGAGLLLALRQQGVRVTVAGLNRGDTDQEAAEMLGLSYAEEAPFMPLSAATLAKSNALAASAELVVVTDAPFGDANIANLEAALVWQGEGKRIVCYEPSGIPFGDRDYTGGRASLLWEHLRLGGAVFVTDTASALNAAFEDKKD